MDTASPRYYSLTVLFVILGALVSCALAVDLIIDDVAMAAKHQRWMTQYGRVYKDAEERQRRLEVFRDNLKYIEDFNSAGPNTYTLGLNEFSDMTHEEFVASHKCVPYEDLSALPDVAPSGTNQTALVAAPNYVDWRQQGVVNTPKNQGQCGSCWAFAATAAVEAVIKMNNGVLYDLSPQQLVDCDRQSYGCKGGFPDKAFLYIARNGITTESRYPYAGYQGACKNAQAVTRVSNAGYVQRNSEAALKEAVARQPIVVAIDGENANLQHYRGGLFTGPCTTNLNHAVLVVGYGSGDGFDYWIVKNSWGASWGVGGYVYMLRNNGSPQGVCGIAMFPSYPVA